MKQFLVWLFVCRRKGCLPRGHGTGYYQGVRFCWYKTCATCGTFLSGQGL